MALTAEERQRYSRDLAEYTMRQFSAARKTLDNHKAAAAKLPAVHAARDGSMSLRKGLYERDTPDAHQSLTRPPQDNHTTCNPSPHTKNPFRHDPLAPASA
ncbi:hypothetical protein R3P38DRAFT_1724348 [Favolaschia claudopus]|uniref:Uncharacterized protein n=1 Tax=Favolaschia claudopus TaxID=2862362 RepID=A0AAW0AAU8_9AGAR